MHRRAGRPWEALLRWTGAALALAVVLLVPGAAGGQERPPLPQGAPLRLAQVLACRNEVTALAVGVNTLWAGSLNGIVEYELKSGRWMAEYGIPEGLEDPQVTGLATDGRGHLWVGTASGLFEATGQGRFAPVPGKQQTVTALGYGAGALWVGSAGGLERWDGRAWETVDAQTPISLLVTGEPPLPSPPGGKTASGEVWALFPGALARVAGGAAARIAAPPSGTFRRAWIAGGRTYIQMSKSPGEETFPGSPVFEVRGAEFVPLFREAYYAWDDPLGVDAEGRFWVRHLALTRDDNLIPGGLQLWKDKDPAPEGYAVGAVSGLPSLAVQGVQPASDGTMWVLTGRGVAACAPDGTVRQRYGSSTGPANPFVTFMLFRGKLSVFLNEDGTASLYDGKTWTQAPHDENLATAVLDRAGQVAAFAYTRENDRKVPSGFVVLSQGSWKKVESFRDLIERGFFTVGAAATSEGDAAFLATEVWADKPDNHLMLFQGGRWLKRPAPSALPLARDYDFDLLAAGPNGTLAAAAGNQLALWTAGGWRLHEVPVPKDAYLKSLRMDGAGNVWMLYQDRILRKAAGAGWRTWSGKYRLLDVAPEGTAWAVPADSPGAAVELTVVSFDRDRVARHRLEVGPLRPLRIGALRFDELGQMWLSTDRGVWRLTR